MSCWPLLNENGRQGGTMSEQFCKPHLARTGERIRAARTVDGMPMCLDCFRGKAIDALEDHVGLPFFVADALSGKNAQAHACEKGIGRGKVA